MAYPEINTKIQHSYRQQLQMLGINKTDNYKDGQLEDCTGIGTDRYPYIATSQKPVEVAAPAVTPPADNVHIMSIFAWEELFMITDELRPGDKYPCWYGGRHVGDIDNAYTSKQYAVINSKLIIWPDKVYFDLLDLDSLEAHPLQTAELLTTITSGNAIFYGTQSPARIDIPTASLDITVQSGDVLMFRGCTETVNDGFSSMVLNVSSETIDGVAYTRILFRDDFPSDQDVTQDCTGSPLQIYDASGGTNVVPDMDFICAHDNRLWGCSSKTRTIYGSALGDPSDFETYNGLSTDSYAVAVGSAGDFTGCLSMNNCILFMKQHCIHKLLGSYPAEYQVVTYQTEGTSATNGLSAVNCNETAMFVAEHGIGSYYGATTGIVSRELGSETMYNALGGFNGEQYYLYYEDAPEDGDHYLYVYDMRYGIWLKRNTRGVVLGIVHLGYDDYVLVQDGDHVYGRLYKYTSGEQLGSDGIWYMTFKPFYETVSGSYNSKSSIFEKKRYWNIYIRMELPEGSTIKAEIKPDDEDWQEADLIAGDANAVRQFVISTPRCDRLQLRLSGTGPMTILALEREFTTGSKR